MTKPYTLHLGDCIEVMRTMPDNSVDSIVCDPPYGLSKEPDMVEVLKHWLAGDDYQHKGSGFMGKSWDSFVPGPSVWREAMRVLKPGGHMLAFSGSRTYHRMTCAIEDAGFDIRDQIQWIYGQGFPKSNNLDNLRGKTTCGCSTESVPYTHENTEQKTKRDLHSLLGPDVPAPVDTGEGRGQVLQPGLPKQSAPAAGRRELRAGQNGAEQPGLEGRGDDVQAEGELQGHPVHSGAGSPAADGEGGRIHNGASGGDGAVVRVSADANGGGASRRPQPGKQSTQQSGTVADEQRAQAPRAWPDCAGCGLPMVPKGLGTALKPAHEPICVARKPLIGTVAANVLAHGVGGLNIDGCRVTGGDKPVPFGNPSQAEGWGLNKRETDWQPNDTGRWPANLILSYNEDEYELKPSVTPEQRKQLLKWMYENS